MSHREVAKELGITEQQSQSAEVSALRKLFFALRQEAKDAGFKITLPVAAKGAPSTGRRKERPPKTKDHWGRPLKKG